jgi:hypothetical protein
MRRRRHNIDCLIRLSRLSNGTLPVHHTINGARPLVWYQVDLVKRSSYDQGYDQYRKFGRSVEVCSECLEFMASVPLSDSRIMAHDHEIRFDFILFTKNLGHDGQFDRLLMTDACGAWKGGKGNDIGTSQPCFFHRSLRSFVVPVLKGCL